MATSVSFPLRPHQPDVEFRFTIGAVRQLEKAAGCGLQTLLSRGESTEALVLMTCYGLRHANHKMTEQLAETWIQNYIDAEGDSDKLMAALFDAVNASGVYGKVEPTATATESERAENPTKETTAA